MIGSHLRGAAVLVTGGTRGIGLATGLCFGRQGAHVTLTHKWGSADEDEIRARFLAAGAPAPAILCADAAETDDTRMVLDHIHREHDHLEVLISNVAFAAVAGDLQDIRKRHFLTSVGYTAWPFVDYLLQASEVFGRPPRYALAMSSDGARTWYPGYDLVAVCKEIVEVLCRYLATHWFDQDVRCNVLSARPVATASLEATFGPDFEPFLKELGGPGFLVTPEEVADAALALCSGLMDGVNGQVVHLDRGLAFSDSLMRLFAQRDRFPHLQPDPVTPELEP